MRRLLAIGALVLAFVACSTTDITIHKPDGTTIHCRGQEDAGNAADFCKRAVQSP